MAGPHLLIDARNALYRAIYAVKNDQRQVDKYHYFSILLRQFNRWMNMYRPSSVHVFWDAPRNTVWRRKALPTYKERRNKNTYTEDISEDLKILTDVAQAFFAVMNVRQYSCKCMEADDLIYAATTVLHPQPTVIISSDSDMIQMPFNFSSSTMYDPGKKKEIEVPDVNPVMQKALTGDKSDCIDGYYGIGPKKSALLLKDPAELQQFLKLKGPKVYHLNLLLIDLSLCPRLLRNKVYVQRRLAEPVRFSAKDINDMIMKFKVNGLLQEYNDLIPPFQKLAPPKED
jgi:5'-3' exonuclease